MKRVKLVEPSEDYKDEYIDIKVNFTLFRLDITNSKNIEKQSISVLLHNILIRSNLKVIGLDKIGKRREYGMLCEISDLCEFLFTHLVILFLIIQRIK